MTDTLNTLKEMSQVTTAHFRKDMSEVLGDVHYNRKDLLLPHHGKPMVVLVAPEDYLAFKRLQKEAEETQPRRAPNGKILLKIDPENQIPPSPPRATRKKRDAQT
ncbi:MAG: type II toxin-antitoxin system Phd/YefM family antitoxin [Alphaproteobacteria bacterium]|nr:MAG: type II toxin-antitoxin system Phd/YefM family antitoxin [Alphaproteobacteria bacterium]